MQASRTTMDTFYQEDDVTVYWDEINRWIYVDWRNTPSEITVKQGCVEKLKLLCPNNCSRVLNDNRNVIGPWNSSAQWVTEDWFSRMISSGLMKFACLQSPNLLSKFAARQSTAHNQIVRMLFAYLKSMRCSG